MLLTCANIWAKTSQEY